MSGLVLWGLVTAALLTTAAPARAGDPAAEEARLRGRLDAPTAQAVIERIRTARAAGLPTQPLVGRAFEGASRGASGTRIQAAVDEELDALRAARGALGAGSEPNELVAGAMALLSGAREDSLTRLRATRPGQSLVIPLVVLADLIARKVPVDAAATTVIAATRAGARDADLLKLREHVERELEKGAAPAGAAGAGLRLLLRDADSHRTDTAGGRHGAGSSGRDP